VKFFTRELLTLTGALVAAYLILTHSTGFGRSVQALGSAYTGGVKALQGR
jgi:hypothetical protein